MNYLIFISNMAGAMAAGLWILKRYLLSDKQTNRSTNPEVLRKKLEFCSYAKYFFIVFVVLKFILVLLK